MEPHGSESYFVIGEGLLGESVGGREGTSPTPSRRPPRRFASRALGPSGSGRQLDESGRRRLVLREAEFNGGKLKGVGARIVAGTFHRAMERSQASIVRDQAWRPTRGPDSTTFRMVDLLPFAFQGKKTLLAPLG